MELILLADALRRSSAAKVTAVVPYFGYARQDRRVRSARVPITAKIVADMMAAVGISRLVTVDLHADQIQGFFYMPVDNLYSTPIMLEDMHKQANNDNAMIVSPDVGGVIRARAIAKRILPAAQTLPLLINAVRAPMKRKSCISLVMSKTVIVLLSMILSIRQAPCAARWKH